jgi:hypothetical protein
MNYNVEGGSHGLFQGVSQYSSEETENLGIAHVEILFLHVLCVK